MTFNIGEFRSQFVYDGARNNLFKVNMQFPLIAGANPQAAQKKFSFMCRGSQIPGLSQGVAQVNFMGRDIKLPGNKTFNEWTVTVLNDEDYIVKNQFDRWMNAFNTHQGNLRNANALNASQYSSDPVIQHLGKSGNVIQEWKLIGAFPMDISPVDLDWANNDNVGEFNVSFAFQWSENIAQGIL